VKKKIKRGHKRRGGSYRLLGERGVEVKLRRSEQINALEKRGKTKTEIHMPSIKIEMRCNREA